jgi:hypothetical protein
VPDDLFAEGDLAKLLRFAMLRSQLQRLIKARAPFLLSLLNLAKIE